MSTDNTSCICGKTRNGLNRTNWQRHLNSCKKRKLQFSACSISKFLVGSTKEFIVSKDDQLNDTTGLKTSLNKEMAVETNIDNNKIELNNSDKTNVTQGKQQDFQTQVINSVSDLNKLVNEPNVKAAERVEELQTEESSNNQKYYNNSSHGNKFEELIFMSSLSTWNNDPAILSKISRFTPEMIDLVLKWGPCQPKSNELPNGKFPKEANRCFHESWYYRKLSDGTEPRDWLTYSPSINKLYCLYCILFGRHAQKAWVTDGFRQFQNGSIALIAHETTSVHVEASLRVKLRESCMPILPIMVEERKKQVAFNREIVRQLVEITKYLGYHSLSFRGHREQ